MIPKTVYVCRECKRFYNPGPDDIEEKEVIRVEYAVSYVCEDCRELYR